MLFACFRYKHTVLFHVCTPTCFQCCICRYASFWGRDSIAKRFFADAPIVKIIDEQAVKSVAAKAPETVKVTESVKPAQSEPKVEKEAPKKKKSSFKPFLYGCLFTVIAGYFFVYQQIWKSANQMEQTLADVSVDVSDSMDRIEQRIERLEKNVNES